MLRNETKWPTPSKDTKFSLAIARGVEPLPASELARLEARERLWLGRPECAIREEMERALERARRRRAMARARAAAIRRSAA